MTTQHEPLLCRCCGTPMDIIEQPALTAGRPAHLLATCWQPDCKLVGYTLDAREYPQKDLSEYLSEKEQS